MTTRRGRGRRRARSRPRSDPAVRERALEALHLMRGEGLSLTRAAREAQTTRGTVRRHVGSVVKKARSGRFVAAPTDRLTRHLWLLTPDGKVEVAVQGSRAASRIARYSAAVDEYLRTGSTEALRKFRGQRIRGRRASHSFVTDPRTLDRLARAGEASFERLYTRRS